MAQVPQKRDPREPTPLILMNPELRVRQLRYAANIEASSVVPLHRYFEVLNDLAHMGLEYLRTMRLERAFIIFKRIEYFVFHRLRGLHSYAADFTSAAKEKINKRLPMIMFVAQQLIIDFIMPVYQRQAAYFRYEELQRRLAILNPEAMNAILPEATRREQEFFAEAQRISTRFGIDLENLLPRQITPDEHHPTNFPPRTHLARPVAEDALGMQTALSMAINTMNTTAERIRLSIDQPVESVVSHINTMMNEALNKFFRAREAQLVSRNRQFNLQQPSSSQLSAVEHTGTSTNLQQVAVGATHSPRASYMFNMPNEIPSPRVVQEALLERSPYEYNPTYPIETYIGLLERVFNTDSVESTGFTIKQVAHDHAPSPSTAGFMLYLIPIQSSVTVDGIVPEPDPGAPRRVLPPVPAVEGGPSTPMLGVWNKVGKGKYDLGSIEVLSKMADTTEVLDNVLAITDVPKCDSTSQQPPNSLQPQISYLGRPGPSNASASEPSTSSGQPQASQRNRLVATTSKSTDSEVDVVKVDTDEEEVKTMTSTVTNKRPHNDDNEPPGGGFQESPMKRAR